MEPFFKKNDTEMFYKYLKKSAYYFEYGSGGSTYQASICSNMIKIYSVESDYSWHDKLKSFITNNNVTYLFHEMKTKPDNWGNPGNDASDEEMVNYSNYLRNIGIDNSKNIDMILIDGRFRVACCLKAFDLIHEDCIIIFDDFLSRPQYHVVLEYFNVVDKTQDNQMVVLKKNKNISQIPIELIQKYELIKD